MVFSLFIFSIFFESLKSKSTQNLRPQKGNSGVSFNDTLLNFGLRNPARYNATVYRPGRARYNATVCRPGRARFTATLYRLGRARYTATCSVQARYS